MYKEKSNMKNRSLEKGKEKNTFIFMLVREFWNLTKLNLLFVIYSVPLITIGASLAAMDRVTCCMAKDKPTDVIYDFRKYFKLSFKKVTQTYILIAVLSALSLFSSVFYYLSAENTKSIFLYVLAFVSASVFMFIMCVSAIFFRLPELTENNNISKRTSLREIVLSAFFLSVKNFGGAVCGGLAVVFALLLNIWYFPYSIPLFLFFGYAFFSVLISFFVVKWDK